MPKGVKRKEPSQGGLRQTTMGSFFSLSGSKSSSKKSDKVSASKKDNRLPPERFGKKRMWGNWAAKDTEEYRNRYPGKKEYPNRRDNLLFYTNELSSRPDGDYIDDIHENWYGDYERLERHHGYIQWLFPIRESGLNWHAQELQLHEIDAILKNKKAKERVLTSYKMMLDFYGMRLKDEETGEIERADNWKPRFRHLNRSFHNYLRITRILKCLGEFQYEYLKAPFIKFILEEAFINETLDNLLESCERYWIGVLRDEQAREEVWGYYEDLYLQNHKQEDKPSKKEVKKKQLAEPKKNTKDKVIDVEADFNSDPDTLEYAMSMMDSIDDSGSDSKSENPSTERRVHTMSDSEEDSQEARYWNKENNEVILSQDSQEMGNNDSTSEDKNSIEISGRFESRKGDASLGSDAVEDGQKKDEDNRENDDIIIVGEPADMEKSSETDYGDNYVNVSGENNNAKSWNNSKNETESVGEKINENSESSMKDENKLHSTDGADINNSEVSKAAEALEDSQDDKTKNSGEKNTRNTTAESIVNGQTDAMKDDKNDSKEVPTTSAGKEVTVEDNMDTNVESNQVDKEKASNIKANKDGSQEDEMDVAVDEKSEEPMES